MLHQKGAWRVVQDLQNDPELQAQLKAQGYDPKAIADEAYNVATGGQIKSASGFKQFYKDVSPDSATQKQNEQEIQDQIDSDAANAAQAKIDAQNKANYNNSWYGKLLNGIGSGVSDVGKGIGSFANEALHNPGQAYQDLNTGAQRVGDQFLRGFGLGNLADYESQQNQALARAELKQNPNNAQAKAALAEDIGATSQAKTGGQKALNYLGGTIGTIAPYLLGDGALGALGKGGTAVTSGISNPIVQKMAQGALSGAVGSGISQGANLATGGKTNPQDVLKGLATSAAFGGGAEALLHGTVPLLKQLNLKGQASKLMQDTGSAKYDPATFEQALKEANAPSGDVSNVVADQKPNMPQPFEQRYNLKPQAPTAQPTDVSNNNWFSSSVMQDHPMLNFTQQGANMPQARGILQDLSVPKAQTGTVNDIADQTLNRANTFSNAPTEGFNQRLLNAQQEMKGLQNNAQKIADQTGGTYNPDIESLYQQIRKPSDPKTFDDLVKAAEMENNVQNPSLKTMLKSDPKIKQAIDNLNALGKPSKQATNLIPEITPKNKGVTIPEVKGAGKTPQDILQDFKVNGGKTSGKGGADLIDQLKVTKGVKLNIGDVLNSLAEQRNYLLNSVKTDKNISKMSKEELTNVANKLEKQHELVSKAGNSKKLKAIEEDMAKVKQAGLKMDLQFFGAHAKANPIEAVREKLFGKVPDKTPQDIAREHAQVNSAVKQLDEKGKPVSEETVKTLQKTKDIMPNQTLTKNIYELADRLPKEIGDKIKSSLDAAKANHVNNLEERSNDLYNKVVQELGIKKGSKESALVQDYGEKTLGKKALEKQGIDPETVSKEELNKINDSELQKIAGNKTDAIKTADQYFRENYKNMIDEVNNTVREIYPNNPDKIVPERQDYYHHFNELDGFEGFKNLIQNSAAIDPHLAGISPNTKPNSKWQSFKQMRGNGAYKSDAVGGYLKYLQAASHSTHLDPMIKVLRNAADQIATATEGTKNLNNLKTALEVHADNIAGKTNPIDRLFQDHIIGRKAMKVLNVVNGHIKKNMILGNLGSALGQVGNVPLTLGKAKQYAPQGLIDTLKYTANHLLGGDKNLSAPMNKSQFLKERFSGVFHPF
jgi:hypothetical protein